MFRDLIWAINSTMLYSAPNVSSVVPSMKWRQNKPLRDHGIYLLGDKTLILVKRSEELSFLFTEENWNFRGPVDFRVSHGGIYNHGVATEWTDEDLVDTGMTAISPSLSTLLEHRKIY